MNPIFTHCLCVMLIFLYVQNATAKTIKKIEAVKQDTAYIEELWLSAQINNFSTNKTLLLLKQADGRLLILAEDWHDWRLKPAPHVFTYQEQDYYYLDELQGVTYQFNPVDLSIAIQVDVSWFLASELKASRDQQALRVQTSTGASLNYSLTSSYVAKQTDSNVFIDGALFYPIGILESQLLTQHLENKQRKAIRLNNTFIKDDMDNLTTLKVGDSTTSNLGLGGGLRFAGVQWGTNFALNPKMIRYPLPSINAQALLPSTVDVFVNSAKSWTTQVPSGTFTLDDIPIAAGKGEAVVVVKDLMGREQRFVIPYYVSAELLKVGLQEYAFESGMMRKNYGIQSNSYDDWFAMVSYRRGLTTKLTGELQLQWQAQRQLLRYGSVLVLPKVGLANAWMAQSWHEQTTGAAYAFGLGVNSQYKFINMGVDWQYQDRQFSQLGSELSSNGFKEFLRVFGDLSFNKYGSLRLQYGASQNYEQSPNSNLQISYGLSLAKYGALTASIGRTLEPLQKNSAQLTLSIPLLSKHSVSLTALPLDNQQRIRLQKSTSAGSSFGYSLSTDTGAVSRSDGTITWQNPYGSYRLRVAEQDSQYITDLGVSGGIVYLGGQGFLSRQVDNSFAVVKVADYANVRVYSNNQLIGKTNKKGMALVPRLRPYEINTVRISASDLPFDAEMTTQELELIPAYKTGVWANFDVRRSYAATMTVLLDNGQPLPAGAQVYKQNSTEAFPVGFRGELYITGLSANNSLTAEWKGQKCTFEVEFAVVDDSLPDLGTYLCKGVVP